MGFSEKRREIYKRTSWAPFRLVAEEEELQVGVGCNARDASLNNCIANTPVHHVDSLMLPEKLCLWCGAVRVAVRDCGDKIGIRMKGAMWGSSARGFD